MTATERPGAAADLRPPKRPPTARDGFRRMFAALPDPRRLAADLAVMAPGALCLLGARHAGTPSSGGRLIAHAWWEAPVCSVAAFAIWGWMALRAMRPGERWRPHELLFVLLPLSAVILAVATSVRAAQSPRIGPVVAALERARIRMVDTRYERWVARELRSLPWHVAVERIDDWEPSERVRVVRPAREIPAGFVLGWDRTAYYVQEDGTCSAAIEFPEEGIPRANRLHRLHPFVLLGPNDVGRDDDLAALERAFAERREVELPTEEAMTEALVSPNPWVRAAASRIVRAWPQRFPNTVLVPGPAPLPAEETR